MRIVSATRRRYMSNFRIVTGKILNGLLPESSEPQAHNQYMEAHAFKPVDHALWILSVIT